MAERQPRRLAAELRRRLGPPPPIDDPPLVSIVVVNRDGVGHLRRLLGGLTATTDYPRLELIVVDNGSSDGSLAFLRTAAAPFSIAIVANPHNESFSDANRQGAELARGELLLFLNNDTEPFEPGWLRELVACLRSSGAGAVSATLLCSDDEHACAFEHGYGVAHRGLRLRDEDGLVHPVLHGWEDDPLDERLGEDVESVAVAAACMLLERSAYERVGGFTHGYVYGAEDVDLCLKLRAAGQRVLCSGRSLIVHHPASTRRAAPFEQERARKLANRRVLWERWGPLLRREHDLDLLGGGGGGWAAPDSTPASASTAAASAAGVCLKGGWASTADPQAQLAEAVRDALERRGRRCLVLAGDRVDDPLGLNYEIALHLRGAARFAPKPAQLNVLWVVGRSETVTSVECSRYDRVVTDAEPLAARLLESPEPLPPVTLAPSLDGADRLTDVLLAAFAARDARPVDGTAVAPAEG